MASSRCGCCWLSWLSWLVGCEKFIIGVAKYVFHLSEFLNLQGGRNTDDMVLFDLVDLICQVPRLFAACSAFDVMS